MKSNLVQSVQCQSGMLSIVGTNDSEGRRSVTLMVAGLKIPSGEPLELEAFAETVIRTRMPGTPGETLFIEVLVRPDLDLDVLACAAASTIEVKIMEAELAAASEIVMRP